MIFWLLVFLSFSTFAQTKYCQYSYTVWNTQARRSEGPFKVHKLYNQLLPHEKGPEGCTVCESDQVKVILKNGVSFTSCKRFAGSFKFALEKSLDQGRKIESVVSYRPSISKGAANGSGLRTEFSHHAFGSAVDINENHNGLYSNCLKWSAGCRLIKGGAYNPSNPLAIGENDEFVSLFKGIGFQWGGQIRGNQKDFMHFSLDGY